jgi:hypothetical protein
MVMKMGKCHRYSPYDLFPTATRGRLPRTAREKRPPARQATIKPMVARETTGHRSTMVAQSSMKEELVLPTVEDLGRDASPRRSRRQTKPAPPAQRWP